MVDEFDHFELNFVDRDSNLVELESKLDETGTRLVTEPFAVVRTTKLKESRYRIVGFRRCL